jgi:mRNA interferase MazF
MKRGEIWLINLDPAIGAEIRKTHPAVIVSSDAIGVLLLKVIVPITDWKEHYQIAPWMIKNEPEAQNGLDKPSAADTFRIRSQAQESFVRKLDQLDANQMTHVTNGLGLVLEIEEYEH